MKTKYPLYLTLLLCSLFLAYTSIADAQKVHACLILLGNDPDQTYRTSVDINQEAMIGLMQLVSRNAEVHMTLMKSEPGLSGEVTHTHLVKMETKARTPTDQPGIIKPAQVTQWIRNLKVGPSDTVFVYFNGHGKVDRYGRHQLLFDKTKRLARDAVLEALRKKSCRLKMLITDTCSEVKRGTHPADGAYFAEYGDLEAKPQFYARNLFLEHIGILDITATSPEIRTASDTDKAFGDAKVGGFFTYALTHALVPDADTNRDDFLSWKEAFAATKAGTKRLCETHPFVKPLNIIQRPVDHTLPRRYGAHDASVEYLDRAGKKIQRSLNSLEQNNRKDSLSNLEGAVSDINTALDLLNKALDTGQINKETYNETLAIAKKLSELCGDILKEIKG